MKATKKNGKTIEYNELEGLQHDFVLWPIPEAKKALKKICSVLSERQEYPDRFRHTELNPHFRYADINLQPQQ